MDVFAFIGDGWYGDYGMRCKGNVNRKKFNEHFIDMGNVLSIRLNDIIPTSMHLPGMGN
jgi:hypothetical protein